MSGRIKMDYEKQQIIAERNDLAAENARLRALDLIDAEALKNDNKRLEAENARLRERVAELEDAYNRGRKDGQADVDDSLGTAETQGAAAERVRIVAWMRSMGFSQMLFPDQRDLARDLVGQIASCVADGDHLRDAEERGDG